MPKAKKKSASTPASFAAASDLGVRAGSWDYSKELAKLNRHWYRRCLDDLGRSLQQAGTSPTVAELEVLCDRTITTFLKSVTSQAPDSEAPQFPADRAYFIPFEGDRAGKFNFAKPYYQILELPSVMAELGGMNKQAGQLSGSLWSCLPWHGGEVRIDPGTSVRNGETLAFQELLSSALELERSSGGREGRGEHLRVRKSLLLRGDDDDIARGRTLLQLFREENPGRRPKSRSKDERGADLRVGFPEDLRAALAEVFEAYRLVPGKADVEELLGNQMDVLRWLAGLAGLTDEGGPKSGANQTGTGEQDERGERESIQLSNEASQFKGVLKMLLRGYFLGSPSQNSDLAPDAVVELLSEWVKPKEWDDTEDQGTGDEKRGQAIAREVAEVLFAHRADLHGTPFFRAVRQRQVELAQKDAAATSATSAAAGRPRSRRKKGGSQGADAAADELGLELIEEVLKELGKHLESFTGYFLRPQRELDLEQRVRTSTVDDPRRAGSAETSFVWVCPDFEDLAATLPPGRALAFEAKKVRAIQEGRSKITTPYRRVFRRLEAEILHRHASAISNYWRMQGQAAREERVFGSFDSKLARMALPPAGFSRELPKQPFPQNIFLRARICDSLNEPVIDGLFVFSTDYDEVKVWNKFGASRSKVRGWAEAGVEDGRDAVREDVRSDDVHDLLSFAKVFFFIVRDYLHGLDRARESADIGLLNQFLYDKRLSHLETRLEASLGASGTESVPLTDERRWQSLVYELLNHYAQSLLDKPEDVRNETFPYDRLLLVPLDEGRELETTGDEQAGPEGGRKTESPPRPLPFYLFQSIFVDCEDGRIDGSHYSLVKPFQSPIESLDSEQQQRFRSRSFQKVYETDGREVRLPRYLEKHYVGAVASSNASGTEGPGTAERGGVESCVVKVAPEDRGDTWARRALWGFWNENIAVSSGDRSGREKDRGLSEGERSFVQFLSRLTRDLEELDRRRHPNLREAMLRFLLRFALLQALLACLDQAGKDSKKPDETLKKLEDTYRDNELKLKFDDSQDLDVLRLARSSGPAAERGCDITNLAKTDIVGRLATGGRSRRDKDVLLADPFEEVTFHSFLLGADEPFLIALFRYFTERVLQWSDDRSTPRPAEDAVGPTTWYQPVLTRPVEASEPKKNIEDVIGTRKPPYDAIAAGDDAMAFFLGTVGLEVGRGQRDVRRLRCLVAMIRDYDDSRGNLYLSEKDLEERLDGDRKDLTLFTQTFFKSAQRNLNVARERQQVRVLTNEIQDIARSWYSRGMDRIGRDLRDVLEALLRRAEIPRLDRLQPESMECLFYTTVRVLCEEQASRDGRTIELESFPFDRMLHVPILFGADQAACLSYVRTKPAQVDGAYNSPYHAIRLLGRNRTLGGGRKLLAQDPPLHLHVGSAGEGPPQADAEKPIWSLLEFLADPDRLDGFVRRLYQADATQTLAVAGTIHHLLRIARADAHENQNPGKDGPAANLGALARRIEEVLRKCVQGVDQMMRGGSGRSAIQTAVYMDPMVTLDQFGGSAVEPSGVQKAKRRLCDLQRLPVLADLFQAIEGEDWSYGLDGDRVRSKVFYVYYSFPVPKGFLEDLETVTEEPCYSGVFCLVLDDVSTDDKLGDQSAEDADQADIRTFFHNVMDRLRMVLEQQVLKYRLARPGTEQFVTGMLHRLKNELNEPAKAFAALDTVLRAGDGLGAEQPALLERMRQAQASIGSVRQIFTQLKSFSDKQQGIVPRQTFSSTLIGWIFVESLCSAAIKELTVDEEGDRASGKTVSMIRNLLEKAQVEQKALAEQKPRAERVGLHGRPNSTDAEDGDGFLELGRIEGGDPGAETQRIQRALHQLESHFEEVVAERGGQAELILSYDVFSLGGLHVRGGYQLKEALNILVENAFQAAWSHLRARLEGTGSLDRSVPLPVQVRMVCRHSDNRDDEVLLEVRNSGECLTPEFQERLNADVAQPIAARRYSRSGGKKRGGSGFGHYFARQIVAETCGGREAGRELGVRIENLGPNLIGVRVNLLGARPARSRPVKLADVLESAEKVFGEARDGIRAQSAHLVLGEHECWLPEDVHPAELLQAIRAVLEADRQRKEEELLNLLRNSLRPKVEFGTDGVVRRLAEAARELLDTSEGEAKSRKALAELVGEIDGGKVPPGSFEDLKRWLDGWCRRDRPALERVVARSSFLAKRLDQLLTEGKLAPMDLLTDGERGTIARHWESLRPYLNFGQDVGFLFQVLGQDDLTRPGSTSESLAGFFKEERWTCSIDARDHHIELEIELSDSEDSSASDSQPVIEVLKDLHHVPLAFTFVQYQNSIRNGGLGASDGGVSALALWRRLDASREGACQVISRKATLTLAMQTSKVQSPIASVER